MGLTDKTPFKQALNSSEKAFKKLHDRENYKPEDLFKTKEYKKLIQQTSNILSGAISDNDIPADMLRSLKNDVFTFSALKTHAQLLEASKLLMTDDGKVKSFSAFSKDIESIKSGYNQNYLEAEYQFAITSSQMAGKWTEVSNDYDLQYRTAADDRVRETHQVLHDVTLPADDAFWLSYYPPNGWRCRCNAVQVRKGKYDVTDSKLANSAGEKATTQMGADGKNKLEIFRFNPGAQKVVFPPAHPYRKVQGAKSVEALAKAENSFSVNRELKSQGDVSAMIGKFAEKFPEYFARGYQHRKVTRKRGVNGFTTMRGDIYLTESRADNVKAGLNNIHKGLPTTFEQEDALSTLHHEMWHNANKPGNMRQTNIQTKNMELANEFVSRKTLPEFMEKLGGKLQNEDLVNNRKSTGYNKMVVNFDKLIQWAGCDTMKVVETVKEHLINGRYDDQITGLIKAVKVNTAYNLKESTIRSLLTYAKDDRIAADSFEDLLKRNDNLLIKKSR